MEGSESPDGQSTNVDHVQQQKMNIFLKVIKTVRVSVKKSDTIRNVKAILNDKEGISECAQSLSFSGECLRDHRKLADCGIQENSMVQVFVQDFVPLRLFVKPQSHHKIIIIEARPCDTVENVKSCIMAKEGTHSCSFNLIYAGEQLAEDRTLLSLGIRQDSTLHMVTAPKLTFPLSVKMPSGEILKLGVKLWYTVRDVKTVVESIAGSPVDDLSLVYKGMYLHGLKSLSLYNITEESMLEMVPKTVQIYVKSLTGRISTYDVNADDLVINLKEKISDEQKIPLYDIRLYLEGKRLCDDQTLASCNIMNGSSLDLRIGEKR